MDVSFFYSYFFSSNFKDVPLALLDFFIFVCCKKKTDLINMLLYESGAAISAAVENENVK